jgi:hypothetical protein
MKPKSSNFALNSCLDVGSAEVRGPEMVIPGIPDQATVEGTVDLREVSNPEELGSNGGIEEETAVQAEEYDRERIEADVGRLDNLDMGPQLLEWRVNQFETMKLVRTHPDAVIPQRMHTMDVGMDISIIGGEETSRGVWKSRTGWAMEPPLGYFFQVTERSSLHESGCSLANKVGIIDPGYQGEVFIVMRKTAAADHVHPIWNPEPLHHGRIHDKFGTREGWIGIDE